MSVAFYDAGSRVRCPSAMRASQVQVKRSFLESWGISAAGSAQHWQCWGHEFESRMLHFLRNGTSESIFEVLFYFPAIENWFCTDQPL